MEGLSHIPAEAGEKVQYVVHDYNDNTIRFILHYPGEINAETLSQAVRRLVESNEMLHSSFVAGHQKAYWMVHTDYVEADYFRKESVTGDVLEAAKQAALLPVLAEHKTKLIVTLIQGKAEAAVVLCLSHLCVDGSDGKYMLYKLAESYQRIRNGTVQELIIKNGSRSIKQAYVNVSTKEYLSLLRNPASNVKSEVPFEDEVTGSPCMLQRFLAADKMQKIHIKLKKNGASINDLFLAAAYRSYVKMLSLEWNTPVSIMSMIDLRRHCQDGESEGLCNMSGTLPTTLKEGIGDSMEETLAKVVEQTQKIKDDPLAGLAGIPIVYGAADKLPMWLLLFVAGKVYGSFALGVTNLGKITCDALMLDGIRPDGGIFVGPVKKKPGVQISVASFDETCSLSIAGQYNEEDMDRLGCMLDDIIEEIEQYGEV